MTPIGFTLTQEDIDFLTKIAKQYGVSKSYFVRQAIHLYRKEKAPVTQNEKPGLGEISYKN